MSLFPHISPTRMLIAVVCFFILPGCFFNDNRESDAERLRKCEDSCGKMTSMSSLTFSFMYYDSADVDSVIVKEISPDKKDTTTHVVKAEYRIDYCCTPRKKVWVPSWELKKEIPLQNEYYIIVKDEAPHRIKDFKMGPQPLCSMTGCNYIPGLKEFELDGKLDTNNYDGIIIRKY